MLTIKDLPPAYADANAIDRPLGDQLHRFAVRLQVQLRATSGQDGEVAGQRLLHSAWQIRYGGIHHAILHHGGPRLAHDLSLPDIDAQFVHLAAFQAGVVALAVSVDLCAAAVAALAGHRESRVPTLRSVVGFHESQKIVVSTTEANWINDTHQATSDLFILRDAFVHRDSPLSVTIGAASRYQWEIDGIAAPVEAGTLQPWIELALDRHVAAAIALARAAT